MAQPVMATSSGNSEGRSVPIARDLPGRISNLDVGSVYESFPASSTQAVETYTTRMSTIESKLGNKDSAKG